MPITKLADTQQAATHSVPEVYCILNEQLDGHKRKISVTISGYKSPCNPEEPLRRHQLSVKVDYTPAIGT